MESSSSKDAEFPVAAASSTPEGTEVIEKSVNSITLEDTKVQTSTISEQTKVQNCATPKGTDVVEKSENSATPEDTKIQNSTTPENIEVSENPVTPKGTKVEKSDNSSTPEDTKLQNSAITEDIQVVKLLTRGLLELYEPPLATIHTHLKELTEKQEAVQGMITSEIRKLDNLQNDAMFDALLADIATNKEKLTSISSSMMSLHKRVQSLQTRASNVEKAAKIKAASQNKASTSRS